MKIKIFVKQLCLTKNRAKILEFSQYQKSDKARFIIYADLKSVIEKVDERRNIPENSST